MKPDNEQSVAYRLTSERVCSAITIDAPILISFTLPYSAYVFAYMFIYQLSQKTVSKVVRFKNLIEHILYEIIADPIEIIGDIL